MSNIQEEKSSNVNSSSNIDLESCTKREHPGGGAFPYYVDQTNNKIWFLFQQMLDSSKSKKYGYLIDFGGACFLNEDFPTASAREFTEETCGFFTLTNDEAIKKHMSALLDFQGNLETCPNVVAQIDNTKILVQNAISFNDHICIAPTQNSYHVYAIQLQHNDLSIINSYFTEHARKIRKFEWVSADDLIRLYSQEPVSGLLPLHIRVLLLKGVEELISQIQNRHLKKTEKS